MGAQRLTVELSSRARRHRPEAHVCPSTRRRHFLDPHGKCLDYVHQDISDPPPSEPRGGTEEHPMSQHAGSERLHVIGQDVFTTGHGGQNTRAHVCSPSIPRGLTTPLGIRVIAYGPGSISITTYPRIDSSTHASSTLCCMILTLQIAPFSAGTALTKSPAVRLRRFPPGAFCGILYLPRSGWPPGKQLRQ